MKQKFRSLILMAVIAVLLVSTLAGCGKNEDETISIKLKDVVQAKDGAEIILETENDTGNKISLGWAGGCEIEVITKENEYYYEPFMTEIPRGESTLTVPLKDSEADVKIEKIVITRLCLLNDRGLPGRELKDVVVYDKEANIDEFEGAFGFFDSRISVFIIILIAMLIIMVIVTIVVVICIISAHKKNKKAMEQFNPYGAASQNMDSQQAHNDAHQRFVQQQQMQQNIAFAQKSVTTTNQGGFVPPPPPPPIGMQESATANCMYCGTELPKDSTFCTKCGKKQVRVYTQTFRRENMSEEQFVDRINQWFAQYPYVGNVKGKFLLHHGVGMMVNKYVLDAFAIEYELFSGSNAYQYGMVKLTSTGLVKTDTKALIGRWQQSNPSAQLVTWEGGVNQRGSTSSLIMGGIGAVNKTQAYVFFKFKRATGTAAP